MGEILKGGWSGDNCVWGGEVAKDEATERGRCWALEGPRGQIKDGGLYAKVSGKPQSHFQQESREEAGRRWEGCTWTEWQHWRCLRTISEHH